MSPRCGDHREHLMPRIVRNSLYFSLLPGNSTIQVQIEFRHRHPRLVRNRAGFATVVSCGNRLPVNMLRREMDFRRTANCLCDGREAFCIIHRSNPLPVRCNLLSSLAASLAVSLSVIVLGQAQRRGSGWLREFREMSSRTSSRIRLRRAAQEARSMKSWDSLILEYDSF